MKILNWLDNGGFLRFTVMVFLLTSVANAQQFTGRVVDNSGAAIPRVAIDVHNQATNEDYATITTHTGDYTLPYLKPGIYSISADAPGFTKETKTDITLETGQTATISFALKPGGFADVVTVESEALLDRDKADRGEVIENTRVTELPIAGRNPVMLDRLNASVIYNGNYLYQRPFDGQVYTNLSINGSGNYSSEILLDGASNQTARPQNTGHHDVAYITPDDAVQDFRIITNPYDAQYGRTRGGVIDMTLKSGTNRIHGDVYEFLRRTWLDANLWQNDYIIATQPQLAAQYRTPQHKLDQWGAEIDGPVVLPKIYDGRNKSFFMLQYENWNEVIPRTLTNTVPDPAWATGDFSNLTYWTGSKYAPITIYDPLTIHADSTGKLVRDPFPNNKIPASRLNPVAVKLLSYWPAPNATPRPNTNQWQNNLFVQNPTTDIYRNALAKWDQVISSRDHLMLRYGYWERYETTSSNGVPGPGAFGEYPLGDRSHTFATQWTHVFTPHLLLDIRGTLNTKAEIIFAGPGGFDPTSLGWPSSLTSQFGPGENVFPRIQMSEITWLGITGNSETISNALNIFPSLTWTHGRHTVHVGLDSRFQRYAVPINASAPAFVFDRTATQNCWSCGNLKDYSGASPQEGNDIASMLLGTAASGSNTINPQSFTTQHYYAPFVQDDWKITPRLTFNLGLRWDISPSSVERHDRVNYAFDTTTVNPANAHLTTHVLPNGQTVNLIGGLTFAGVNGAPRSLYSTILTNIQPRVGFAFALNDKMILRGGFGELFENPAIYGPQTGYSAVTSYVGSNDGGKTLLSNLSNPFPSVLQPTGSSLGMLTGLGTAPTFINPNFRIPNVWTFSLGYEIQLAKRDLLEISYVGNRAPNNSISQNINHWDGAQEARCNIQMGGNHHICDDNYSSNPAANLGYMPNPFYHVAGFEGSSRYTATTLQGLAFTEPFPAYNGITETNVNGGRSWYNSLQVTASHKWDHSLTLHATWTWSKFMEAGGWADSNYLIPARNISSLDRTHNITLSGVYLLPVGRGRTFLSRSNRIVDWAVGGWELGALSIIQSGAPWGAPAGFTYLGNGATTPKVLPDGNLLMIKPCIWQTNAETGVISPTSYATAFGCTQPDFIQNPSYAATQNVIYTGIRQPSGFEFNTNLSKFFTIEGGFRLQLRLEALNVLNHPLFQNGFYTTLNPDFGSIGRVTGGGQSNLPRQIQIGAKLMW